MTFSVITPSFQQIDWLRLCVASVRDQVAVEVGGTANEDSVDLATSLSKNPSAATDSSPQTFRVEHIIQDACSDGIEEFAREVGADFHRDGQLISCAPHNFSNYCLKIYSEQDGGMYDAINRGLARSFGEVCSYLNCDEQYLPRTLDAVEASLAEDSKAEVVFGDTIIVDPMGMPLASRPALIPTYHHSMVGGTLSTYTAATFFTRRILKNDLLFNSKWRDLGDAEWLCRIIRSKSEMRILGRHTTTFTDTGANMNFGANALRERSILFYKASVLARIFRWIIIFRYRCKKLLAGHYFQKSFAYRIYTRNSPDARVEFDYSKPRPYWNPRRKAKSLLTSFL